MSFEARFGRYVDNQDARGLYSLLQSSEASRPSKTSREAGSERHRGGAAAAAADFAEGVRAGDTQEGLEAFSAAFQHWCQIYATQDKGANVRWMVPPMLQFALAARRLGIQLDREANSQQQQKRVVETLRGHFQKMHRDKYRREGALVMVCELLRLYFRLDQAAQCTFLLNAVHKEGLDVPGLPRALSVPFCFLWGKYCIVNGDISEAEPRLGWALANCPPKCFANRRRIMEYLVPCRLCCGLYPKPATLRRYSMEFYEVISKAVSKGDIRTFNEAFERHSWDLIGLGTYQLVEKLKVVAYRNLIRKVYDIVCEEMIAEGQGDSKHKQDLAPYERALLWQDDCDADETICILANLTYSGAVRGYLSDEHHKFVFSKQDPFPKVSLWGPKA